MLREINFKVFRKLLDRKKLRSITLDIDSCVVNVEGHQEGTAKGYNPKRLGNLCYNIRFTFCDELKAYITGFVRSGNTNTANSTAEMIKEIAANIKTKEYPTPISQVTGQSVLFMTGEEGRETVELLTKQNTWGKDRRYENHCTLMKIMRNLKWFGQSILPVGRN